MRRNSIAPQRRTDVFYMGEPSRYAASAFPPYRYVPGKSAHPTRDRDGHSYARVLAPIVVTDRTWRDCEPWLFAVDLFNHGYYWESHEYFEAIWHGAGHDTAVGVFAQGLVQAAAAVLKRSMGQVESATRLASAAGAKLRGGASEALGVRAHDLAARLEDFVSGRSERPPRIALDLHGRGSG